MYVHPMHKVTIKMHHEEYGRMESRLANPAYYGRRTMSAFIRKAIRETLDRIDAEEKARLEKSDDLAGRANGRTAAGGTMSATRRRKSGTR